MELIPLAKAPDRIYRLPFTYDGVALILACSPDGMILRTHFMRDGQTVEQSAALLAEACRKLWPQAEQLDAPKGFTPDTARFHLYGTAFQQAVWQRLAQLKSGETVSYGQLANELGKPGAARAVGAAVGANPYAPFVPCHRVLAANGAIGGFAGGTELKRQLLQAEGIIAA